MGKRGPAQLPRAERFRARTAEGPAPAHRPELGTCLLWTGTTFEERGGYGSFYDDDQRLRRAHRVAWEIETGETLAPDQHVLHWCDVPPCVRFKHLYLGDQAANMDDMREKGRGFYLPPERGIARYNAQLTDTIVLDARRRYAAGEEVREIVAGSPYRNALKSAIYGQSWKHVEMPSYEHRERKRGEKAPQCPEGHAFTTENTAFVIDKDGYRNRYCKQCNRDRARRYAREKRRRS
jgi:hypothetical protein